MKSCEANVPQPRMRKALVRLFFIGIAVPFLVECAGERGMSDAQESAATSATSTWKPDWEPARPNSLLSPAPTTSSSDDTRSREFLAGHARGATEALEDFQKGAASVRVSGMRASLDRLDRATGLNVVPLGDCFVDDETTGRVLGYNEAVGKLIKERGLPAYSRKRWEREFYDLKRYLSSLVGDDTPVRLYIGGRGAQLRDGTILVKMGPELQVYQDGKAVVWNDPLGGRRTTANLGWSSVPRHIEVADGPVGAEVLVFQSSFADRGLELTILDLRTGQILRTERHAP